MELIRPTRDQWAMELAITTSRRSTCCRRNVGCVLLNDRGHVIATGYNGVAAGLPHCNERVLEDPIDVGLLQAGMVGRKVTYPFACDGAVSPSGTDLDACHAIHAEQNALLQCKDVYSIDTAYVTASPCIACTKLLLNTSCRRIIYRDEYPHPTARRLWTSSGRDWEQLQVP
ncbi:ComEB Deoxycytidylate deaminase [uncultured Caudovirales phage]|uniref:ComEB Deoxycytidylate deaminase n=1 Tax=uncultured Caudovirales phage TaxID=2100421 RepID=A0A6J5SEA0_9CAUD|nr:ComEB Deoxycytidylate deaminase [uncultured Caudovirales phage]CAB4211939.1 ComEB Deoxycytidylate deaminase [uncultured Caudovirales phage]